MPDKKVFLMAGGGTGGHVIPLLAVANELRTRGHEAYFVGTERGAEARLVPAAGFPLEFIRIGGLQGVSVNRKLKALVDLIRETARQFSRLGKRIPDAVFSLGWLRCRSSGACRNSSRYSDRRHGTERHAWTDQSMGRPLC